LEAKSVADAPDLRSAYIPSILFAKAIGDLVIEADGHLSAKAFEPGPLQRLFIAIHARTEADTDAFYAEVGAWFNNAMSQGTAIYKRRAQLMSFLVGLMIATVFNIDAVRITKFSGLRRCRVPYSGNQTGQVVRISTSEGTSRWLDNDK
jgi:hypothetical protein